MNRDQPTSLGTRAGGESTTPRGDVRALLALVTLDEGIAKRRRPSPNPWRSSRGRMRRSRRPQAAITSRIPREALEDYESALRRGLVPAAVATRGQVCWGCFHPLSAAVAAEFLNAQAFVRCPHCERVLFNPDWNERP